MRGKYELPLADKLLGIEIGNNNQTNTLDEIDMFFDSVVTAINIVSSNIPTSKFSKHLRPYWCEERRN